MHAAIERNSWRLPPEDIVQVADPRSKKAQPGQETDEDLVYTGASEGRNWWSVVLSLLVISLVIAGILTAIHTLGYVDELLYWSGRRMTLDEYLQGELCPARLPPTWVSHRHFVFQSDDGGLRVYDSQTDIVSTLVSNHTLRQLNVKWFQCSGDLKYILLRHDIKQKRLLKQKSSKKDFTFEAKERTITQPWHQRICVPYEVARVFKNSFTAHYTIYDVDKEYTSCKRQTAFIAHPTNYSVSHVGLPPTTATSTSHFI